MYIRIIRRLAAKLTDNQGAVHDGGPDFLMQQSSAFPRKQGDCRASLVLQMMRYPPAMQETGVQSLGREDPLEKEMVPPPVFLPGETHGQRSLVGYSPWGHEELDTTE